MIRISYSGYTLYKNCPSAFYRKYIAKEEVVQPEPNESGARKRGLVAHRALEEYLMGEDNRDPIVEPWRHLLDQIREKNGVPEKRWGFDAQWEATDFLSEETRVRGILDAICYDDAHKQVEVYEWKTGREYPDHADQRALYGLAGLLLYPEADTCKIKTVYLDSGKAVETNLSTGMSSSYKWVWDRNINSTQPPQPYRPRPNWKCRFCPYSEANGGTCPN